MQTNKLMLIPIGLVQSSSQLTLTAPPSVRLPFETATVLAVNHFRAPKQMTVRVEKTENYLALTRCLFHIKIVEKITHFHMLDLKILQKIAFWNI